METSNYQVLLGDAEGQNTKFFNCALACCPAFQLFYRASSITELITNLAGGGNFVRRTDFCGPDVVLLDLDLSGPGSGFEVLQWIQAQATRLFRVVVFSSRRSEKECARAYALGADGFVTSPRSVTEMIAVLTRIETWLRSSVIDRADDFCVA
jgi:DNA-binding NarL/FixJ family response regulator